MDIVVEKSQKFLGTTTVNELKHRTNMDITYYRVVHNNRHMAILNRACKLPRINNVIIVEKQKIPLWKQDMQMRMGRMPRAQESRRVIRVQEITPEEASKYRIEVYETRF